VEKLDVEKLVRMANDIGRFFQAEPDHQTAVEGVASHLKRFWDPRMRKEIIAHVQGGGAGLIDLAREAVLKLEKK
jgi:formate dehydrogenase subunit delta